VPRLTFFALLGAVIDRGCDHREVFKLAAPGVDWRALDPVGPRFWPDELYPDAAPAVARLRQAGLVVAAAGNQQAASEAVLAPLRLDLVVSSETLGAAKPDPDFFLGVAARLGVEPAWTMSVGDRVDNDVLPALEAGMKAVHLRRGPWGRLHANHPEARRANAAVNSLTELVELVAPL
jgi:FMN phosphatase YigB (HAD superfamily)